MKPIACASILASPAAPAPLCDGYGSYSLFPSQWRLQPHILLRRYNLPHPFISFSFAAIAIAFWYAGTGPGLLAVVSLLLHVELVFHTSQSRQSSVGLLSHYLRNLRAFRELV